MFPDTVCFPFAFVPHLCFSDVSHRYNKAQAEKADAEYALYPLLWMDSDYENATQNESRTTYCYKQPFTVFY
jgi:hypothetical protein